MRSEAKVATDADRMVGSRIASIRKARGISQTDLGNAIGVTFQQVQKYEKGANRIGSGRIQQVAQFLGVKVSTLFEDGDEASGAETSEIFNFLAAPGASELLQIYSEIADRDTQHRILNVVRQVAALSVKSASVATPSPSTPEPASMENEAADQAVA